MTITGADYSEIQMLIQNSKRKGKILILGSNQPPEEGKFRDEMIKYFWMMGYKNTIKMESIEEQCKSLDEKFYKAVKSHDVILAILTKSASREGVCWEIGFMQGLNYHDKKWLYERLFVCIQKGVTDSNTGKESVTKMVSGGLLSDSDVKVIPFADYNSLCKSSIAQMEAQFLGSSYV